MKTPQRGRGRGRGRGLRQPGSTPSGSTNIQLTVVQDPEEVRNYLLLDKWNEIHSLKKKTALKQDTVHDPCMQRNVDLLRFIKTNAFLAIPAVEKFHCVVKSSLSHYVLFLCSLNQLVWNCLMTLPSSIM